MNAHMFFKRTFCSIFLTTIIALKQCAWWCFWCCLRRYCCVYRLLQLRKLHLNGFSLPKWVSWWLVKLFLLLNVHSHPGWSHRNGLSFVCVRICCTFDCSAAVSLFLSDSLNFVQSKQIKMSEFSAMHPLWAAKFAHCLQILISHCECLSIYVFPFGQKHTNALQMLGRLFKSLNAFFFPRCVSMWDENAALQCFS